MPRLPIATVLLAGASIAWRLRAQRQQRTAREIFAATQISVVATDAAVAAAVATLREDPVGCVGVDAEWVKDEPVSLLQVSNAKHCFLFHLSALGCIPSALAEFLEDPKIVKAGVGIGSDATRLRKDYAVVLTPVVELCVVIPTLPEGAALRKHRSLKALTQALLGVELNKDLAVVCSNWGSPTLTAEQISYASDDAMASYHILRCLHAMSQSVFGMYDWTLPFHNRVKRPNHDGDVQQQKQQCRAKRGGKLPPPPEKGRSKDYYDNIKVCGTHGKLLFTCCKEKADWYVSRSLAKVRVWKDEGAGIPAEIQLLFAPKCQGTAQEDETFFLAEKRNCCTICGSTSTLLRHSIIPPMYRKLFPPGFKIRNSHDVVLVCAACFPRVSSLYEIERDRLAVKYNAPYQGLHQADDENDMRKFARSLLRDRADPRMPAKRLQELEGVVTRSEAYKRFAAQDASAVEPDKLHAHVLTRLMKATTAELCPSRKTHADIVVEHACSTPADLQNFIFAWRELFLSLNPTCLPGGWRKDFCSER